MNPIDISRSDERVMFKYAGVLCIEDEKEYTVYLVNPQSGAREQCGDSTRSIHKAWVHFIQQVDMVVRRKIEKNFGPFGAASPWVDPDGPSRYIADLQSPIIRPEYEKRQIELNGRVNTPLDEIERLRFDLDMVEKYRVFYPLPEVFEWKLKSIEMQYRNALRERDEKRLPQQA